MSLFPNVSKAQITCKVSDHPIRDRFADIGKTIDPGSGGDVGRNKRSALRRMDWCNALRLLHPTGLNAQARELEQTIALNVAEILEA